MPRSIRILRHVRGVEAPETWATLLSSVDLDAHALLKSESGRTLHRARLGERDVAIKRWPLTPERRLSMLLGRAQPQRHWRAAEWLISHGFSTARPLALAAEAGRTPAAWLVLEWVSGQTLLAHIAGRDLSIEQDRRVASAIGVHVARLTAAGRFNRDHKPSNVVLASLDPPDICIIDVVGLRVCRRGSLDAAARMFASLMIEPLGLACPPSAVLARRAVRAYARERTRHTHGETEVAIARRVWRLVRSRVESHGDPTPRVDPLASPV